MSGQRSALYDEVTSWFDDLRPNGSGAMARCPAHDDQKQSLHISVGNDGRVLLNCFAGCETSDVLKHVGKSFRDLFPREAWHTISGRGREQYSLITYDYTDEAGQLLY